MAHGGNQGNGSESLQTNSKGLVKICVYASGLCSFICPLSLKQSFDPGKALYRKSWKTRIQKPWESMPLGKTESVIFGGSLRGY